MATNYGFYEAYLSSNLEPGKEMRLASSVYSVRENADISKLIETPLNQLEARLGDAEFTEQKIFERAKDVVREWEAAAGKSLLIKRAIEFVKTPAVAHSANQWAKDGDYSSISNAVYKMSYHVYEETKYDRTTQKSVPAAWHLTWSVYTQSPGNGQYGGAKIAGQDRKRFTDKAAMEKYLQGRIKTYANLFTEVSPPIPKKHEHYFRVNGQLLPGYTVADAEQSAEHPTIPQKDGDRKPSLLNGLAANKAEIKAAGTPAKEQGRTRPQKDELA